ncbi:hypothetical protein [Geothrix sp. 21YS21S-4]|uniref:hypothetical protein n=1 Tax=Geothrix sp. 21YS21S-4 TaxID=3068889 RepID=UPI0027BA56E3|nr:hypothetical protein [Geothrix sp. 21YS21S-4]
MLAAAFSPGLPNSARKDFRIPPEPGDAKGCYGYAAIDDNVAQHRMEQPVSLDLHPVILNRSGDGVAEYLLIDAAGVNPQEFASLNSELVREDERDARNHEGFIPFRLAPLLHLSCLEMLTTTLSGQFFD